MDGYAADVRTDSMNTDEAARPEAPPHIKLAILMKNHLSKRAESRYVARGNRGEPSGGEVSL